MQIQGTAGAERVPASEQLCVLGSPLNLSVNRAITCISGLVRAVAFQDWGWGRIAVYAESFVQNWARSTCLLNTLLFSGSDRCHYSEGLGGRVDDPGFESQLCLFLGM